MLLIRERLTRSQIQKRDGSKNKRSIEIFKLNGDKELAIENYQKSLELNPKNANAIKMLRKLKEEK